MRNRASFARPLQTLFHVGTVAGLTDAELLERFANRGHEESELAFAALVERHGAMVHGVIRRVLSNPHDAQDAFQATFLVLLERAHSIRKRGSIVSWLHGVALRVAWASRLVTACHRKHEQRKAAAASRFTGCGDPDGDRGEIGPIIHEELTRLPERYRAPLILCYLEGLTHEQAAARLIWPVGTVKSRLSRGRDRLRDRLLRRGVEPSAGVMSVLSFRNATDAALPAVLVEATVQAALDLATGRPNPGGVATTAAAIAEEAMKSIFSFKLKTAVLALTIVAAGGVVLAQRAGAFRGRVEALDPAAAGRILVLEAPGGVDQDTPTTDEIWNKFVEKTFPSRNVVIEKIGDRADACKVYPLAGPCQLVHRHYRCTLHYDERRGNEVEHSVAVIYIDKDYLRPCTEHSHSMSPEPARAGAAAGSAPGTTTEDPASRTTDAGSATRPGAARNSPGPTAADTGRGVEGFTRDDTAHSTITTETPRGEMPSSNGGRTTSSDQERRLAEVERKLDRVLRLLEASTVEKR